MQSYAEKIALLEEIRPLAALISVEVWWDVELLWFRKLNHPGPQFYRQLRYPSVEEAKAQLVEMVRRDE